MEGNGESHVSLDPSDMSEGNGQSTPQLLEQFQHLPANVQRLIISLAFLTLLVRLVIVKSKVQNAMDAKASESAEEQSPFSQEAANLPET